MLQKEHFFPPTPLAPPRSDELAAESSEGSWEPLQGVDEDLTSPGDTGMGRALGKLSAAVVCSAWGTQQDRGAGDSPGG